MSWISGIADRAEQLLVKIDQSAADKLQKKKPTQVKEETVLSEVTTDFFSNQQVHIAPSSPAKRTLIPQVKSAPTMVNQSQEEDKLIDFLNDNSKKVSQAVGSKTDNEVINLEEENQTEVEKQLLKNEVRVLNNELSLLLHRTRAAEKVSENLKTELDEVEKSKFTLQNEMETLRTELDSLDDQNQKLRAENNQFENPSQKEQLVNSEISSLQSQLLSLQAQHDELALRLESRERECTRVETARQLQQQEIDSLNERLVQLRVEQEAYRARAQRTLADKETLITQLRASHGHDTDIDTDTLHSSLQTELIQIRKEKQSLVEEHDEKCSQLVVLQQRLVEVEKTLESVRVSASRTQQDLQERITQETHKRRIIEDDYRMQTQELRLVSGQVSQLTAKQQENEAELRQVRSQLSSRPTSPSSHLLPGEIEMRLSNLTKTLIQKQTALESATTERNQLRVQLEELEHKHREHLMMLHQARIISANDTDDVKAQVPSFMVESPFDTGVARRVKRAYSSLDAISIRTGVFLRRYPLARILVILYVVLLHSLVLLVLYSRTPDNAQN